MAGSTAEVVVAYATQVDKDTTASGVFTAMNKRSGGFVTEVAEIDEGTVNTERLADAPRAGRKTTSGTFEFSFRESVLDDFLANAFASSWVDVTGEDELVLAKVPTYMTFVTERSYLTASTRHYRVYSGCVVSGFNVSMPQDGIIGLSMNVSAANLTRPATAPWSSLVPPAVKEALRTCTALTSVKIDDVEVGSIISNIDLSMENANRELFDVRQCDPKEIILGAATINGTITAYHDDESDQWDIDAESSSLYKIELTIVGETVTYRIVIPSATNRSSGPDDSAEDVTVALPFGAVSTAPSIFRTNV